MKYINLFLQIKHEINFYIHKLYTHAWKYRYHFCQFLPFYKPGTESLDQRKGRAHYHSVQKNAFKHLNSYLLDSAFVNYDYLTLLESHNYGPHVNTLLLFPPALPNIQTTLQEVSSSGSQPTQLKVESSQVRRSSILFRRYRYFPASCAPHVFSRC